MLRHPLLIQACVLALASPAFGQLIGPIPPATPPAPAYVPGAPNPPAEIERPPSEPVAPSIIERTPSGDLRPPAVTAEQAAVEKYPFSAEARAKIAKSLAARELDIDRFVIANLDKVRAARAMRAKVESAAEYAPLFEARDLIIALRYERLINRLLRDGAINMGQRARLDEALRDYDKARAEQITKDTAADPNRTAILHLRQSFHDATRELFDSLDRQIQTLTDNFEAIAAKASIPEPDQSKLANALAALKVARGTPNVTLAKARKDIVRALVSDELGDASRRMLLNETQNERATAPR